MTQPAVGHDFLGVAVRHGVEGWSLRGPPPSPQTAPPHSPSPHVWDPATTVHVFRPAVGEEETGRVLIVPAQSTPRIKETRDAGKDEIIEARVKGTS